MSSHLTTAFGQVADPTFRGRAEPRTERQFDFRMQDADGRSYTMADFRGRVVLLFFGYTHCPDACPNELGRLAHLLEKLGPQGEQVKVLFATLDPERDTPDVLRAYPAVFNPSFLGLRSSMENTLAVANTLKVYFEKIPGRTPSTYTIDHSVFVYGFDPKGNLRVRLTPSMSLDDVVLDVKTLLSMR